MKGTYSFMGLLIRKSLRWAITISLVTSTIALVLSLTSTTLMSGLSWSGGLLVLIAIVAVGIGFDMLGIAATAAREGPFHAMASRKIPGAKEAIGIVRRADQFSNFCNDVVGDISGVISGSAAFTVVASLMVSFPEWRSGRWFVDVLLVSLISALTVGGKALGKTISIHYSQEIVLFVGKVFHWINRRFDCSWFHVKPKKKSNRKRGVSRAPRASQLT
jgi:CBS domain containing-hemolysin-like protein